MSSSFLKQYYQFRAASSPLVVVLFSTRANERTDGRLANSAGNYLEKLANLGPLVRAPPEVEDSAPRIRKSSPVSIVRATFPESERRAPPRPITPSARTTSSDRNLDRDANAADGKLVTRGYAGVKA